MAFVSAQILRCSPYPSLSSSPLLQLPMLSPLQCSPSAPAPAPSAVPISRFAIRGGGKSRFVVRAASTSDYSEDIGEILGSVRIFTASGESVLFQDLWDQNEGIAVVALLRHFGCPCCWELASALKESKEKFDSFGVKLIAVGVGTPDKARILAERVPFPLDSLYADPDRKAYDVLSLYYGFGRTFFNPASAKVFARFESLKKAVENYTIDATPDDRSTVLQQTILRGDFRSLELSIIAKISSTNRVFTKFAMSSLWKLPSRENKRRDVMKESGTALKGGMFVFKGKKLLYGWKDEGTGDHAPMEDVYDLCCKQPVS